MDTTNTSHTPGPWRINHAYKSDEIEIVASDFPHATVHRSSFDGRQEANARLIAAAPELLEALQLCVRLLARFPATDPNGETVGTMVPEQARAAIAKATKGQNQ